MNDTVLLVALQARASPGTALQARTGDGDSMQYPLVALQAAR
jgi:hypothetical protein